MENLTLEQEFIARVFMHKISITGGVLMQEFMKSNTSGNINLLEPILLDMADDYSNKIMQNSLNNGTFNELYEKAWEQVKDRIPDDLCIIKG